MVETAAHLVDSMIPHVPVRPWVLSLPMKARFLLAYDARLCREVKGLFVRIILSWLRRRAKQQGIEEGQSGAVAVVQRAGGSANLLSGS